MVRGIAIIKFLVKFDCFENEVVRLSVKQLWLLCAAVPSFLITEVAWLVCGL